MILKILIGFALGYIAACVTFYILQKRERRRRKEKKKKVSLNTYAKVATTAVLAHGMILTSCSYILSWIGMDPVLTVAAVRTLLDILRAGTYTQSQQSAIQNLENALLIID